MEIRLEIVVRVFGLDGRNISTMGLCAAIGLIGVVAPSLIVEIERSLLVPFALYVVAAFRIGVGMVLLLAAADSRLPAAG